MAMINPWATRKVAESTVSASEETAVPSYAAPDYGSYAVPRLEEGDAYTDYPGWSPTLHTSTVETPSAQRLGTIPRFDEMGDPTRPDVIWDRRDADDKARHSVEDQDADGWTEHKGILAEDRRWAPNPRSTPPPEPRPTSLMAPRSYSFTRLFDQLNRGNPQDGVIGTARTMNGTHFSMADHRRTYEILGMAPTKSWRNTYRLEPAPWDTDVVDMPPNTEPDVVPARIQSVEVPAPSRAWRL